MRRCSLVLSASVASASAVAVAAAVLLLLLLPPLLLLPLLLLHYCWSCSVLFFFKQKTAYEIMPSLVGSEMCIRDSQYTMTFFFGSGKNYAERGLSQL